MPLAGDTGDNLGRGADEDAHRQNRALLDDDTFDNLGTGADETVILDDHRAGLERVENTADTCAARQMDILADLRAGSDCRPCIDHGAAADMGSEIDEAWHQHGAGGDMRGMADGTARHGAEAGITEFRLAPAGEFRRHLIPPGRLAAFRIVRA